jgi:hypothetical protein
MAKWDEIKSSATFQESEPADKLAAKQKYFNDVVVKTDRYKGLDTKSQASVRNSFAQLDPTELVAQTDPYSIDGIMEAADPTPMLQEAGRALKAFKELPPIKAADKFVDKAADIIGGNPVPKPGESNAMYIAKNLPRMMAGELARSYKPGEVLPFVGAAKLAKPALEMAGKAAWGLVPEGAKKVLTQNLAVGRGAPQEYLAASDAAALERQAGAREAEDIGSKLFRAQGPMKYTQADGTVLSLKKGQMLPQEMQQNVGAMFRGEFDAIEKLKSHPQYTEMKTLADEGRAIQDKWSKALVDSGIPSKEVEEIITDNIGQYMARMYRSKLARNDANIFNLKNMRLNLDGLKKRQDLSEDVRQLMGEIKEPALPVATRVAQTSKSIANEKLFKQVADNPQWSSAEKLADDMVQMPDTATMGSLRKKWVIPEIAGDINAITQLGPKGNDLTSWMFGKYQQGMSAWKFGKVVLNPATHARNMLSNSILLDLSGVNHGRQAMLMPKAIDELMNKGKLYQEAVKHGAIGGEFYGGDIKAIKDWYTASEGSNLQKVMSFAKIPADAAGNLYQAEEQVFKLMKFADGLERGLAPERAAQEAQKWLFDYTKIPEAIKFTKNFAPFITFTYKAVPRVAEALLNNPMRVYKYKAMFEAWNESARKLNGKTPEEFAKNQKALPPWLMQSIGGLPANLMMPWKDKYGRTQWLNLEYVIPLGQAPDIAEQGVLHGGISNPVLQLYADLDKNIDFKGQPIVPAGSTREEATKIVAGYIYKTLAPSFAPALGDMSGGYSWEKVVKSLQKQPDYAGRLRELGPVLFDTLAGLKVTPVDVDEAEGFKMQDKKKLLIELRKQAMKVMSPAYNEKKRDKDLEIIYKKMQKVMDEK